MSFVVHVSFRPSGEAKDFTVKTTTTGDELIHLAAEEMGVPVRELVLIRDGVVMDLEREMSYYGIESGGEVVVFHKPGTASTPEAPAVVVTRAVPEDIPITLELPEGPPLELVVPLHTVVNEIGEICVNKARLIRGYEWGFFINGRKLNETQTLKMQDVRAGTQIRIRYQSRGGFDALRS